MPTDPSLECALPVSQQTKESGREMIRKMLLLSVCLVTLFATAAVAEEYPPKPEAKTTVTTKAAVKAMSVPKPLAKTGTDTAPMVMVAGGLIVVGGALVASVRRRHSGVERQATAIQ